MLNSINLNQYFEKLAENSWVLIPFEENIAQQLLQSAKQHNANFKPAALARQNGINTEIRSDHIYWLDEKQNQLNLADIEILKWLTFFMEELRQYFRTSLTEIECHYSIYQNGQHYERHSDAPLTQNKRVFTFVIYLNKNWNPKDGGQIIGYRNQDTLFKLNPEMGQMLLFKSELEHEVLKAHQTRYALTGWMRK